MLDKKNPPSHRAFGRPGINVMVLFVLASWLIYLGFYAIPILSSTDTLTDTLLFAAPRDKNGGTPSSVKNGGAIGSLIGGRRVIYQCTCTVNDYWNVDLGRGKQWRRALQRIDDLVPEIEVLEFTLDKNSTYTCEDLILKDMTQSGPPDAYEIIYSPWYKSRRSNLDLSKWNISEFVETATWNTGSSSVDGSYTVRPRGVVRKIEDWGETFDGRGKTCNPTDVSTLHLTHSKRLMTHQRMNCNVIHVPEQVDWATMIADKRKRNETVRDLLTKRMTREEARTVLDQKEEFAGLIVMSSWKPFYEIDSLVRHALCDLLTEQYKPCEKSFGWKGDVNRLEQKMNVKTHSNFDTVPLYSRYKFAIAINNAMWEGYMTEKEINPYLAGSVAIVGAPDYSLMANANRVVHCTVPIDILVDAGQWARKGSFMPFNTTPLDWENDPSIQPIPWDLKDDEGLMQFAMVKFREALKPCIAEIIRLDKDDEAYISKLMEPYILKFENSLFDGTYVASALLRFLIMMRSPLMIGLESSVQQVHIDDQTLSDSF